jgi:hypothetical protein
LSVATVGNSAVASGKVMEAKSTLFVNVACAVSCEYSPVASSVNICGTSCPGTIYPDQIFPAASAVAYWASVYRVSGGSSGGACVTSRATTSPGAHPDPVMIAISPAA